MYYYGHSSWENQPNDTVVDELFDAKHVAIVDHREGSESVSPQSHLPLAPTYSNQSHHSHHSRHSIDHSIDHQVDHPVDHPVDLSINHQHQRRRSHPHQQDMYSEDHVALDGMALPNEMERNLDVGGSIHNLDDHLADHLDPQINGHANHHLHDHQLGDHRLSDHHLPDHQFGDHLSDPLNDGLHDTSITTNSANASANTSLNNMSVHNLTSNLGMDESFNSHERQNQEFANSINDQYFSPALSFQGTPLMSPQALAPQNPHGVNYNRYRNTPNLGKITKPSPSIRWRSSSVPELDELGDFDLGDSAMSFLDSQPQSSLHQNRAVGQGQVNSKVPVSSSPSNQNLGSAGGVAGPIAGSVPAPNAGPKEFDIDDKLQAALNATTNATTSRRASVASTHSRRASNASSHRGGSRTSTPRIRPKISLSSISSSNGGAGGAGGNAGGPQTNSVSSPNIDPQAPSTTNSSFSSSGATQNGIPGSGNLEAAKNGSANGRSASAPNGTQILNSASSSPSIQPLVGGGSGSAHFQGSPQYGSPNEEIYDTFAKSNYQNLIDGTHQFLGLAGAERMATSLKSKKTVHKIAEKERRNRMSNAIIELSSLMGPVDDPNSVTTSKAATVERAIVYIKKLHVRLQELEQKVKEEGE